jgi:hypothetical protein
MFRSSFLSALHMLTAPGLDHSISLRDLSGEIISLSNKLYSENTDMLVNGESKSTLCPLRQQLSLA